MDLSVARGAWFVARHTFLNRYGAGLIGPAVGPDLRFDVSKKRSRGLSTFGSDPKRLKLSDLGTKNISRPFTMAARRRTFRKRRRSFRKRRFRRGRRGFARRVKRVIFRALERKSMVAATAAMTLTEGDGVARVTLIHSPVSNMAHGNEEDSFDGNQFWLKGLSIRGQLHMDTTTPPSTSAIVRLSLVHSREQGAGFNAGFVALTSATTAITNPVQVPPNVNPRLFQNAATFFTGAGYVVPFDTTRVKVIRSFILSVNPGGDVEAGQLSTPTLFKCYVPIKRMMQVEDALQGPIGTPPIRFKNGTYYWVLQVIASQPGSSSDTVVNMTYQSVVYFRDP